MAIVLRQLRLGEAPFHPDEAIHAYFSYGFAGYRFDPVYHGPLLYHLVALLFNFAGEYDYTARLVPALLGIGLVALILGPARSFSSAVARRLRARFWWRFRLRWSLIRAIFCTIRFVFGFNVGRGFMLLDGADQFLENARRTQRDSGSGDVFDAVFGDQSQRVFRRRRDFGVLAGVAFSASPRSGSGGGGCDDGGALSGR